MQLKTTNIHWHPEDNPERGPVHTSTNIAFKRLVENIRENGLLNPVFIDAQNCIVPCVGGHYRFWAAMVAGLKRVPFRRVKSREECLEAITR